MKTEVTEEHPTTPTHHHQDFESPKADEEVTIAQLSSVPASKPKRKPKPKSIYSAVDLCDAMLFNAKFVGFRDFDMYISESVRSFCSNYVFFLLELVECWQDEQMRTSKKKEKIILKIKKSQSENVINQVSLRYSSIL